MGPEAAVRERGRAGVVEGPAPDALLTAMFGPPERHLLSAEYSTVLAEREW